MNGKRPIGGRKCRRPYKRRYELHIMRRPSSAASTARPGCRSGIPSCSGMRSTPYRPPSKFKFFTEEIPSWERGLHLNPGVDRLKQTHGSRLSFHELPLRIRAKRSDVLLSRHLLNTLDAEIVLACVEIKILRRVRAQSSRPPRHRRDVCLDGVAMPVPHRLDRVHRPTG